MQKKASPQKRQVAEVKILETFELGKNTRKNAGAEITVYGRDGKKLGAIKIGSGSFEWWANSAQKPTVHKRWEDFATLMENSRTGK